MTKKKTKLPKIGKRNVSSNFEWEVWKAIKGTLPKGATASYETEKLKYITPGLYLPDFIIELKDGRKIYIETKGYFKYSDRAKMLAVKESNPDLDIRLLFMRDSPSSLGKGSKTKPSEWATKYGFPFAVGELPLDWFKEEI